MALSENKWPFPLVLKQVNEELSYTPRNDFGINARGLPVLLLEVVSKTSQGDKTRMLLQAACLVRFGHSMLKPRSPKFLVKAIYIDENYCADEYTLFLREDPSDAINTPLTVLSNDNALTSYQKG